MKKQYYYILAMILLAVSCEKEDHYTSIIDKEPTTPVQMVTEKISGSRGVPTKVLISDTDASFSWTDGDDVAVHISNGKYVYTSDEGACGATITDVIHSENATFTVVYQAGYCRDAFAVYPSTIVAKDAANYGQEGHSLDVTLPGSYTLAQVSGETSPCPMISTDVAHASWDFYQLCGLLRLKVDNIPAATKRLEFDFGGKKVWGDFSIAAPVVPGTSAIESSADDAYDTITLTKDGSNVAFGAESLVLNLPLPAGTFNKITVMAYDALTGGNALQGTTVQLNNFTFSNTRATKRVAALGPLQSTFNFIFKNNGATLDNVRFARVFSVKNKLHNSASTYGPYTASAETDLPSPLNAVLYIEKDSEEQLVFQVVTNDGKVYAGSIDAPSDGYNVGETYDVPVDVNVYTFTVSAGQKVCFSPGDLGIDNNVFSFTEPFTDWGRGNTSSTELTKRSWFDHYTFSLNARTIYGIASWRIPGYVSKAYEWNNIIKRTMNTGVSAYYKVTISGHQNCLLLPPDETVSSDIEEDLTSGTVTDYVKYLGKGFVLLMGDTSKGLYSKKWSWSSTDRKGYYWAVRDSRNRYYFETSTPVSDFVSNRLRIHIRYVHNVE